MLTTFRAPPLTMLFVCTLAVAVAAAAPAAVGKDEPTPLPEGLYARWHTPRGTITAELFPARTPLAVAAFVGLAEGTIDFTAGGRTPDRPFFDGLKFHRVVPGFVVQGGDPLGDGEGGPGFAFADEFSPGLSHDAVGTLAMANAGPNTNGSQFYFTLGPVPRLDYKHSVFGRVIRGLETLTQIEQDDTMERVEIVRVGGEAERYQIDEPAFARLRASIPGIAPRDPALSPLFHDTAGLELPEWQPEWLNEKLHHYHAVTGTTVRVRTVSDWSRNKPGTVVSSAPFNPLRALHRDLAGDDPNAATLVFVADENRWRLWLGDGLLPRFDLADGDALHALKRAILAGAKAQMEAGIARRSVDAAVTALIGALDRPDSVVGLLSQVGVEKEEGATTVVAPR